MGKIDLNDYMLNKIDCSDYSNKGLLRAVLDPLDVHGFKNIIIDKIQWNAISPYIKSGTAVLDFGCGAGRFYKRIKRRGATYLGVDTYKEIIEMARKINGCNDDFIYDPDGNMDFGKSRFNNVISVGVLQYFIKSDSNKLSEIRDALKPGGIFIGIEQASESGGTSGVSIDSPTSEKEYLDIFSRYFNDVRIIRVRSGSLSWFTQKVIGLSVRAPLAFHLLGTIASIYESVRIRIMNDQKVRKLQYYDILIIGNVNG